MKVTANGHEFEVEVNDPADVEILEDLVLTGVRAALAEGRRVSETEMKKLTAGMGLPPGMGF